MRSKDNGSNSQVGTYKLLPKDDTEQFQQDSSYTALTLTSEQNGLNPPKEELHPAAHDVVQWSAPIFYVEPREKVLSVDVMRIGMLEGSCKVSYTTVLTANSEFTEQSGCLEFSPKEDSKVVELPLPVYDHWSTTSEFKIKLFDEVGCTLATYLHTCRVKVIRTDSFPSPKFANISQDEMQTIGGWYVYFSVVWMLFRSPGITWRTVSSVIIAQSHNIYLFATLMANKYMVDAVLDMSPDKDKDLILHGGPNRGRNQTLMIIAALYICPIPFLHVMKVVQEKLDLRNCLLGFLRCHMLNQFLNYSAESRAAVGESRFQSAINDEVTALCASYERFFEILKLLGKILVLALFVIKEDPSALTTSSAMPAMLFIFSMFRSEVVARACRTLVEKNIIANRVVQETCFKYDLISQYQQRPRMLDIFRFADNEAGDALLALDLVKLNNKGFAAMLGPLFNAWTIAAHGPEVLDGSMSLGTFLATISVYREFSELYDEIYELFMGILGTLGTTKDLTSCFNMPLDLIARKDVNRMRRRKLKEARAALLTHDLQHGPPKGDGPRLRTDRVNLEIVNLCWAYEGKMLLDNVSMVIPQGQIIGVCGPHGSGKATLMQILAGILVPQKGSVFVPSHLRALYVPEETLLLSLSAWANLIFGFPQAHPARVKEILIGLGMLETLRMVREDLRAIGRLEEMDEVLNFANFRPGYNQNIDELAGCRYGIDASDSWHHTLCNSERSNFALARALITNPELLILQRPLSALEPDDKTRVMTALAENVSNHGYKLPPEGVKFRRPRTLFVSSSSYLELNFCSCIWRLDLESGGVYKSNIKQVMATQRTSEKRTSRS